MSNVFKSIKLQLVVLLLTIVSNIALFVGALVNWTDALRPPFISACLVNAISFTVQYLLGKFVPGEGLPKNGGLDAVD